LLGEIEKENCQKSNHHTEKKIIIIIREKAQKIHNRLQIGPTALSPGGYQALFFFGVVMLALRRTHSLTPSLACALPVVSQSFLSSAESPGPICQSAPEQKKL
jgi:hypothetical protein